MILYDLYGFLHVNNSEKALLHVKKVFTCHIHITDYNNTFKEWSKMENCVGFSFFFFLISSWAYYFICASCTTTPTTTKVVYCLQFYYFCGCCKGFLSFFYFECHQISRINFAFFIFHLFIRQRAKNNDLCVCGCVYERWKGIYKM